MSRHTMFWGWATGLGLALAIPAPQDAKHRFEPFGREASIKELIAEGFKEAAKVGMEEDDLARAADEIHANLRSWIRAVGRRWGEEHLHRRKIGELTRGYAILQVRAGAGGGNPNQVRLNGKTSPHVDFVSQTPLKLGGPVGIDERATAYCQAGYVPRGKVFVIKSIEYWGTAKGDSNGHGEFKLAVPGEVIKKVSDTEEVPKRKWRGRIVVRPGLEDEVWLEVANSSQGEAIFRGMLVDEKYADPEMVPTLKPEEITRADRKLIDLDADDIQKRESATKALVELGPGVVDYLKSKLKETRSADLKAKISYILEQFGEEP